MKNGLLRSGASRFSFRQDRICLHLSEFSCPRSDRHLTAHGTAFRREARRDQTQRAQAPPPPIATTVALRAIWVLREWEAPHRWSRGRAHHAFIAGVLSGARPIHVDRRRRSTLSQVTPPSWSGTRTDATAGRSRGAERVDLFVWLERGIGASSGTLQTAGPRTNSMPGPRRAEWLTTSAPISDRPSLGSCEFRPIENGPPIGLSRRAASRLRRRPDRFHPLS